MLFYRGDKDLLITYPYEGYIEKVNLFIEIALQSHALSNEDRYDLEWLKLTTEMWPKVYNAVDDKDYDGVRGLMSDWREAASKIDSGRYSQDAFLPLIWLSNYTDERIEDEETKDKIKAIVNALT